MKERDSHETYKVAASRLHWIALGLFGSLLMIVLGMYWLARPLMTSVAHEPAPVAPPAPRLQPNPASDLAAVRRREQDDLSGYEWVDRTGGVARIPIGRAMQLLARSPSSAQGPQSPASTTVSTPVPTLAEPPR